MANIEQQLILHETNSLRPYIDSAGKITIGVGRNLTDNGISSDESELMFRNDIAVARLACKQYPWFDNLSPIRQRVILDMMFNMGPMRFSTFVSMIQYIAQGNLPAAGAEMMASRWAQQVGSRAVRLHQMWISDQDYDSGVQSA